MEANELRIGNYAVYGGSVTRMDVGEFIHFVRFPETYSPVPLTVEWLKKFGFNGDGDTYAIEDTFFELIYNDVIGFRFSIEGRYAYPEIKYVHQLQNLYFALTGEELSVK